MTQFRKKPVVITAITFDQLVTHGTERCKAEGRESNIVNGMPWSFSYAGHPITHENDDCYLIPTLEGTMKMGRDDMLITGVKGEIYPCKRDIFEATYDLAPADLEQEIQAKADKGPRVTPAALKDEIVSEHYFTAADGVIGAFAQLQARDPSSTVSLPHLVSHPVLLDKSMNLLTFCVLVLRNGFTVTGESACASPENFDPELGRKIARQNAVQKIWPLLGFRLRDELARPALTEGDVAADAAGTCRPDNHTSACTACKRA